LGVRQTTGDDVEHQPLMPPFSMAAMESPRRRAQGALGIALALVGGAAVIFLLQVSWGAILLTLAVSSIGSTLLIRRHSPRSLFLRTLGYPLFWEGVLEYAAILIAIAIIPALIGVGTRALLTCWVSRASAA